MLRFFTKTKQLSDITDSTGTKILNNYHLKTLMLWACELKPSSWWIDDLNVVRVSIEMLHIFAEWLKDKSCRHYFVNNCNLLDTAMQLEIIASQLVSITESRLSMWFVNNYIRKCAQGCPVYVSRLFDDIGTSMKLQNAVSAVVDWRVYSAWDDLWVVCSSTELILLEIVSMFSLTEQACACWISELAKIDARLSVYFTAVAFLHVATVSVTS